MRIFFPAGLLTVSLVIHIKRILMKKKRCSLEQKSRSWGEVIRSEHVNALSRGGGGGGFSAPRTQPKILLFARGPLWRNSVLTKYKIELFYLYYRLASKTFGPDLRPRLSAQTFGPDFQPTLLAQTCGQDLRPRLAAKTCGPDLRPSLAAQTSGPDLRPRLAAQTCGPDLRPRIAAQNCGPDLRSKLADSFLPLSSK